MMWKPGISRRLLFTSTAIIALGVSTLFLLTGRQLNNATLEFYVHDLESEAFVTAGVASGALEEGEDGMSGTALQAWLLRRQSRPSHDLTFVNEEGRIIASTDPYAALNQIMDTPEIRAALQDRTMHDIRVSMGREMAFAAAPVLHDGHAWGAIIVSAPMQPAHEDARSRQVELVLDALLVLIASLGVSWWMGQSIIRPIRRLHASALRIAHGALDERIEVKSKDEIGQLGEAFNFMATQVSGLLQRQRSFVSNAAHELRTPLMSLKLRTQALLTEGLPEAEKTTYLQEIDSEVNRLASLVTDLLILARVDEGKLEKRIEPFDIVAFFQDVVRQAHIQARQHQHQFHANVPDSLPDVAIGMNDLRIILDNLLNNAMKYTPTAGVITLDVSYNGPHLRIAISDTGEGFAAEQQPMLFERFYRVERMRSQQVAGTGLGLSVVKTIVEHYGGQIQASSPGLGQGATFEVRLPLGTVTP